MKKIEVDVLDDSANGVVIQLAARKFPGIVLQGDSLFNLWALVNSIKKELQSGRQSEAKECVDELQELLSGYLNDYERTLNREKIELPYRRH